MFILRPRTVRVLRGSALDRAAPSLVVVPPLLLGPHITLRPRRILLPVPVIPRLQVLRGARGTLLRVRYTLLRPRRTLPLLPAILHLPVTRDPVEPRQRVGLASRKASSMGGAQDAVETAGIPWA